MSANYEICLETDGAEYHPNHKSRSTTNIYAMDAFIRDGVLMMLYDYKFNKELRKVGKIPNFKFEPNLLRTLSQFLNEE